VVRKTSSLNNYNFIYIKVVWHCLLAGSGDILRISFEILYLEKPEEKKTLK